MKDLMRAICSASLLDPDAIDPTRRRIQSSLALQHRFKYETFKPQDAARSTQKSRSIAKTVLAGAFFMDATLPVDRIYALHSLLVRCGLPLPKPDYDKALEVVYEEVVWAWIHSQQDLSIIQTAARPTHVPNLPSWVPAYHLAFDTFVTDWPAFHHFSWGFMKTEGNPYAGRTEAEHSPKVLRVKGKYIGKITFSWSDIWTSVTRHTTQHRNWCRHVHVNNAHARGRGSPGYDDALREMFEAIMFPGSSTPAVPDGYDDAFSTFKMWFDVMIDQDLGPASPWAAELPATPPLKGRKADYISQAASRIKHVEAALTWMEPSLQELRFFAFCVLDNGMMGMANHWCEVGDEVFLLRGADCPFVLRRDGEDYRLVGPTYVPRLYQAQPWRFDGEDVWTITLV